jgi:hypothetical protein
LRASAHGQAGAEPSNRIPQAVTRTTYYATALRSPLSLLSERTNARFVRCLTSRKHRPGPELTYPRPYTNVDIRLPICRNCGVPMTGKLVTWNGTL